MATNNVAYSSFTPLTISLGSLATSSTFVAGQEATAISNSSNLYVDAIVTGKIRCGTTPTINTQILVYAVAALDATPTWPDVFDGTDSAETLTSVGVGQGFLRLIATLNVDSTTSDRDYFFTTTLAQWFGGVLPRNWTLFVTHNTGVNLNATGGNHVISYAGVTYTVA